MYSVKFWAMGPCIKRGTPRQGHSANKPSHPGQRVFCHITCDSRARSAKLQVFRGNSRASSDGPDEDELEEDDENETTGDDGNDGRGAGADAAAAAAAADIADA